MTTIHPKTIHTDSSGPSDPARFADFACLCEQLAATASKLAKRALIAEYFRSLDSGGGERSLAPGVAAGLAALYLAGSPFPATEGRRLNVGGALLRGLIEEWTGAGPEAMHAAYLRRGDLGGAVFDLLGNLPSGLTSERASLSGGGGQLTLLQVEAAFRAIAAEERPAAKRRLLRSLLEPASPLEAKYLIKIILGDMRIGVQESLIEDAIAAAYGAPVASVRRATMLNGSLAEALALASAGRLDEATMKLFHPLGFMLASPVDSVDEALDRFRREIVEEKSHELDPGQQTAPGVESQSRPVTGAQIESAQTGSAQIIGGAQIEDKYDGIRAQVHCGDPQQQGRVALFSRSRGEITASFPELVEAFSAFPEPAILDGEILAWAPGSELGASAGRALPFTALQPRLGRKRITAELRQRTPVVFMAFDLLYAGGELLLEQPLAARRQILETLVERAQPATEVGAEIGARQATAGCQQRLPFALAAEAGEAAPTKAQEAAARQGAPQAAQSGARERESVFPRLVLAPARRLESVEQLERAYQEARARGNEGVMVKSLGSVYQPGRRGLAWLKMKRELATLDVVVTAAEYGHGKRAGLLSDYTFAVRDGEALRNVGKAYSGVTDAEIERLTRFFLEHTIEDFGIVRSVEPVIVLEVAFNNVMRSDRHESGYALRFPRIVRIRDDKPVAEIDTLQRVEEIYRLQEGQPSAESLGDGSPGSGAR